MNEDSRTAVDAERPDAADAAPLLDARRVLRWTAVIGVGVLAVLACWQDPSYAQHTGAEPAAGLALDVAG